MSEELTGAQEPIMSTKTLVRRELGRTVYL